MLEMQQFERFGGLHHVIYIRTLGLPVNYILFYSTKESVVLNSKKSLSWPGGSSCVHFRMLYFHLNQGT
jgi:hypothetical protein